jgi:hypothetical protein
MLRAAESTLILPQPGTTGVSGPQVLKDTSWKVVFGPVRARDSQAFLANGMRTNQRMRKIDFGLRERLAVAPVELVQEWPFLRGTDAASTLLALSSGLPTGDGSSPLLVSAVLVGTIAVPVLLPLLPFRVFSLKGAVIGSLWGLAASPAFNGACSLSSG